MANVGTPILGLPTTVGGLSGEEWVPLVQGGTTKRTQAINIGIGTVTSIFPAGIDYVMSGGASAVPLGVNGSGIQVPFDCTINAVVMVGDAPSGSAVVDIWKCTAAQYDGGSTHPVVGDSITGGNPLTIVADSKVTSDLNGWTAALSQGDFLWYNVDSVATFTSLTVAIKVSRTLP